MEQETKLQRKPAFWAAVAVIVIAGILAVMSWRHQLPVNVIFRSLAVNHWFSIIAAAVLVIYTPVFYNLKRRKRHLYRPLLQMHMIGNLLAFLLASIHMSWQLTVQTPPLSGSGLPMYLAIIGLVGTGILQRFGIGKMRLRNWRFIHQSMAAGFFLIIFFHVAHGLTIQ